MNRAKIIDSSRMSAVSDLDVLCCVFDNAGVKYRSETERDGTSAPGDAAGKGGAAKTTIVVEGGYAGFMTLYWFDASGALIATGAYE